MADPKLRAVPDPGDDAAASPGPAEPGRVSSPRWVSVLLGVLLALTLALLVWSRLELAEGAQQISSLEDETRRLQGVVAVRDRQIAAQSARLSDVRTHVQSLLSLLDEPVESR